MHIHRYPHTYVDAHMNTHTYTHHIHANIRTYTLYTYIQIQCNGFLMHLYDVDVIHRHTPLQNITKTYFPFKKGTYRSAPTLNHNSRSINCSLKKGTSVLSYQLPIELPLKLIEL